MGLSHFYRNLSFHKLLCLQMILIIFFAQAAALQDIPDPLLPESVGALEWSPDGNKIYIGAGAYRCDQSQNDYSIRVVNPTNPENSISDLDLHHCRVTDLSLSPDGTKLVSTAYQDSTVLWDLNNNKFTSVRILPPDVLQNEWRPNSNIVASIRPYGKSVMLWNTSNFDDIELLQVDQTNSISWNSDGTKLAVANDAGVQIWHQNDGNWQLLNTPINEAVTSIEWSPDDQKLAGIIQSGTKIRVWNANTGQRLVTFREHTDKINDIAWRSDSRTIASVSDDKTLRLWDIVINQQVDKFDYNGKIYAVDWKPDGSEIVFGGFQDNDPSTRAQVASVGVILGLIAHAGEDQNVLSETNGTATVTLDGSLSRATLGTIASYEWSENGVPLPNGTGVTPQVTFSVGRHTIVLKITNDSGLTDTDEVVVFVVAPTLTFTPTFTHTPSKTPIPANTATNTNLPSNTPTATSTPTFTSLPPTPTYTPTGMRYVPMTRTPTNTP